VSIPANIDKLIDGFPHPMIPPIIRIPTNEAITKLNLQLNANTASMQSNLGNGQLGLLALTISPSIYNTFSAVAFVPPANPGTTSNIPGGATGLQISAIIRQHTADANLFQEYLTTDNALKQQVIGAINSMYLHTLSCPLHHWLC
jgi:hypothetical protein